MPVYSSNSPYFLQYLASTFTREQILNDPDYCYLLEDPDIKDDVELALSYQKAKNGSYDDKKEFISYFLANGPELDAQTVFYYRDIILNNQELNDIFKMEFSYDIAEIQFNLRESTYNKDTSRNRQNKLFFRSRCLSWTL